MTERPMPSNVPPGTMRYRRRLTGDCTVAVKLCHYNRHQVAAWVGGDPWAAGVVIPFPDGEIHAPIGAYVLVRPDGWWSVWPAESFLAAWRLEVGP